MPDIENIIATFVRALITLFGVGPVAASLQIQVDAIRAETEKELEEKFPMPHD